MITAHLFDQQFGQFGNIRRNAPRLVAASVSA
jgi:hypothetical protein